MMVSGIKELDDFIWPCLLVMFQATCTIMTKEANFVCTFTKLVPSVQLVKVLGNRIQ